MQIKDRRDGKRGRQRWFLQKGMRNLNITTHLKSHTQVSPHIPLKHCKHDITQNTCLIFSCRSTPHMLCVATLSLLKQETKKVSKLQPLLYWTGIIAFLFCPISSLWRYIKGTGFQSITKKRDGHSPARLSGHLGLLGLNSLSWSAGGHTLLCAPSLLDGQNPLHV